MAIHTNFCHSSPTSIIPGRNQILVKKQTVPHMKAPILSFLECDIIIGLLRQLSVKRSIKLKEVRSIPPVQKRVKEETHFSNSDCFPQRSPQISLLRQETRKGKDYEKPNPRVWKAKRVWVLQRLCSGQSYVIT